MSPYVRGRSIFRNSVTLKTRAKIYLWKSESLCACVVIIISHAVFLPWGREAERKVENTVIDNPL